jgi:hypothetical protein
MVSAFSATIFSHLLSTLVSVPPSASAEPNSSEYVDALLERLLGEKQTQSFAGKSEPELVKKTSGGRFNPEPESKQDPGNKPSEQSKADMRSMSLVEDIRKYRLVKFILFDLWILPVINNAQRFGFLPPNAPPHQIRNLNAFARYLKITIHAPFTQRDALQKLKGIPLPDIPKPFQQSVAHALIPPFISGIYNCSSGQLVQLFRAPPAEKLASQSVNTLGKPRLQKRSTTVRRSVNPRQRSLHARDGSSSEHARKSTLAKRKSRGRSVAVQNIVEPSLPSFPPQEVTYPAMASLSLPLQRLNALFGMGSHEMDISKLREPPAGTPPTSGLEYFCWRVATDNEKNRIVNESYFPKAAVIDCVASVLSIVCGTHPAAKLPGRAAPPPAQRERSDSIGSSSTSKEWRSSGAVLHEDPEVVRLYLRCLRCTLLHTFFSSVALDHVFANNKRLFQQLVKKAPYHLDSIREHLILNIRDQPIVDSNALSILLAPIPFPDKAETTALPSNFFRMGQKLLVRQLFLATGSQRFSIDDDKSTVDAAASKPQEAQKPKKSLRAIALAARPLIRLSMLRKETAAASTHPDDQEPTAADPTSASPLRKPSATSPFRRSSETEKSDLAAGATENFHVWYPSVAAALCLKAASAISESLPKRSHEWERSCRISLKKANFGTTDGYRAVFQRRESVVVVATPPLDESTLNPTFSSPMEASRLKKTAASIAQKARAIGKRRHHRGDRDALESVSPLIQRWKLAVRPSPAESTRGSISASERSSFSERVETDSSASDGTSPTAISPHPPGKQALSSRRM